VPLPNPLTLVLLVTIAVGVTVALLAYREREEPGAKPLVVMLAAQCWWSAFLVFQVQASTLAAKELWVNLSWIGVAIIPVAWLLFALEYTGQDQFVRPRYVAALSVVPAITIVVALTGEFHDLLYVDSEIVEQGGREVIDQTGGPWYAVATGYTYLLGVAGMIPLLGLVTSDAVPFQGQSLAILVGALTPAAINVVFLGGGIPLAGLDPTPIGFAISGVAFLAAISRFRLFGTNPAPNQNARRLVFERMHEAAIVVDTNDNVVELNENGAEILEVPPREALGSPAGAVIPEYGRLPEEGPASEHLTVSTDGGTRFYDVTVTRISNVQDRTIGRVIIFHDVGEHLRQQQRLEVLNRVLRHNIRTETNIICGYADRMATGDEVGGTETVREHAMRINQMGEKAREIEDIFERSEDDEPVSLDAVLRGTIASIRDEYPDVEVEYDAPSEDLNVARVLDAVFSNVLENAAEHNTDADPRVEVDVEPDGDRVRVRVTDNGPGIDEYERSVLERGTETALEHGSGLGLWLIKWGTSIADGRVTFEENDPTGSVVTVEVPILSRSGDATETAVRAAP
jgi:PAS domain S-box-containing protein